MSSLPDVPDLTDDGHVGYIVPRRPPAKAKIRKAVAAHRAEHETEASVVCPPEWDMAPHRYQTFVHDSTAKVLAYLTLSVLAACLIPLAFVLGYDSPRIVTIVLNGVGMFGAFTLPMNVSHLVTILRLPFHRLIGQDPKRVLMLGALDRDLETLIEGVARVDGEYLRPLVSDPEERKERLTLAYDSAARLLANAEKHDNYSLDVAIAHCPETINALVASAMTNPSPRVRDAAIRAQSRASLYLALSAAPDEPTPDAEAVSPEQRLRDRWADAVQTHDRVAEEWGTLASDPLTALTHSALFDVTQPRTAAFIEAYGNITDLRSLHGTDYPRHSAGQEAKAVAREYVGAVRKTDTAWAEAVRYAEHVAFDWLPEAEAVAARRAAGFLAVAADEAATFHERAAAAGKAADLLRKVTSFLLPPAALAALDGQSRLELEPAAEPA